MRSAQGTVRSKEPYSANYRNRCGYTAIARSLSSPSFSSPSCVRGVCGEATTRAFGKVSLSQTLRRGFRFAHSRGSWHLLGLNTAATQVQGSHPANLSSLSAASLRLREVCEPFAESREASRLAQSHATLPLRALAATRCFRGDSLSHSPTLPLSSVCCIGGTPVSVTGSFSPSCTR